MRRARALGVCAVLLASTALAHAFAHPRHLLLEVGPQGASLHVSLELSGPDADPIRRLFDRNRDGRLSAREADTLASYLARRALGQFQLKDGDKPLPLMPTGLETKGLERFGAGIFVEGRWSAAWEGTKPVLSVSDGGDTEGHAMLALRGTGVTARLDLPRSGENKDALLYALPAHTPIRLLLAPAK